jgi:hypothetical protein
LNIEDCIPREGPLAASGPFTTAAALCMFALIAWPPVSQGGGLVRPGVTVPDLIALTRVGSDLFGADVRVTSPDGSRVAVVIQRANLSRNVREFSLLVFNTSKQSQPDSVAQFSTSSNRPGISQVVWWSNDVIGFLAESAASVPQVFTVDLQTHRVIPRTHSPQAVTLFKAIDAGKKLIYATEAPPQAISDFSALRSHGFVVPPDIPLSDVIAGNWQGISSPASARARLYTLRGGEETSVELPSAQYGRCTLTGPMPTTLSVAPSGDLALVLCRPTATPAAWSQYPNENLQRRLASGSQFGWWIVLDLRTGAARPLTGGPSVNSGSPPRWTQDSRAVVLVRDYLSMDGAAQADPLTAEIDLQTGRARIVPEPRDAAVPESRLEIREGPDDPWKLVAVDPQSHKSRIVYDPNPELTTRHRLAQVTVINWTVKSGAAMSAGLYWPVDYVKGRRYPLVIQTHGFKPDKFAPDGYSTTGYAAQPLATSGIMVVQAYRCSSGCDTAEYRGLGEGPQVQEAIEELIDRLDVLGLIDRRTVGLQGYSRSCYHELYFMTHSHYPIATMTCADGVDESYLQYLIAVPSIPEFAADFESRNGGPPFGPTLKNWLERTAGFNLDRIHVPIQLTALSNGSSLLGEWEPFASLIAQGKPAELIYIPDAAHNIVKPWERFTSQQGAVDWFRFWLQGYERTEPVAAVEETSASLSQQYARWRRFRDMQQRLDERRDALTH